MVFTTVINFARSKGPDEIWRKRRIFKLSAHYFGRGRNCYSIAVRLVHRAMVFATKGRKLRKLDMKNLWDTRLEAGCNQHHVSYSTFRESMSRNQILLNRKVLADLAAWEPYSFRALTDVAKRQALDDDLDRFRDKSDVDAIIASGTLKSENKGS